VGTDVVLLPYFSSAPFLLHFFFFLSLRTLLRHCSETSFAIFDLYSCFLHLHLWFPPSLESIACFKRCHFVKASFEVGIALYSLFLHSLRLISLVYMFYELFLWFSLFCKCLFHCICILELITLWKLPPLHYFSTRGMY